MAEIKDAISNTEKRDTMIKLIPCERRVLVLLIAYRRFQPVADASGRSVHTIRCQHTSVMRKLAVRNSVEIRVVKL